MKHMNPSTCSQKGFTLVEVLLSVSILASLSALMGLAMSNVFESRAYFESRFERFQITRNAMNRMVAEISSTYLAGPQHGGKELPGEEADLDELKEDDGRTAQARREPIQFGLIGKEDRIDFTSFAHVRLQDNERAGRHSEISYFVRRERDDDTGRLVQRLMRREDTTYDDNITKGGVIYVMIPEIKEIEFSYWDPGKVQIGSAEEIAEGRWVKDWDTTRSDHSGRLPTRIRIRVVLPAQLERNRDDVFVTQAFINSTEVLEF